MNPARDVFAGTEQRGHQDRREYRLQENCEG